MWGVELVGLDCYLFCGWVGLEGFCGFRDFWVFEKCEVVGVVVLVFLEFD